MILSTNMSSTGKMTHQIYNAISQTELELLTFRGNVTKEAENLYEVEWHIDATPTHPEKKVRVEVMYENGGIVASVLEQEEVSRRDLKQLMNTFMEKLQCDQDQMDVDWAPTPKTPQFIDIPILNG
jgi:hypothetical protein